MTLYNIGPGETYETFTELVAEVTLIAGDIVDGGDNTLVDAAQFPSNMDGVSGNPIIFRNAKLTSNSGNYSGDHRSGSNYWRFIDVEFIGGSIAAFRTAESTGTTYSGCTFSSQDSGSTLGYYASGVVVDAEMDRCDFSGNGARGFWGNQEAVSRIITNSTFNENGAQGAQGLLGNITFSDCEFARNDGHGFWSDSSDNGIIRDSISHDNYEGATPRHGFCVDTSVGWIWERLIAYNSDAPFVIQEGSNNLAMSFCAGYGGIDQGILFNGANSGVTVYNSSFISESETAETLRIDGADSGNTFKNCLFYNNVGGDVLTLESPGSYQTMDYNCYMSSSIAPFDDKGTHKSFSDWITDSSQDANSVFIHIDGLDYNVYYGSDPTTIALTLDYSPINAEGKIVNKSDNPLINSGIPISGVNEVGTLDPWATPVTALPNIGASQAGGNMSDPLVIECPVDEWVKVATAVKSGTIHRKSINPSHYLQTYRATGSAEPEDDTDAAELFCNCDTAGIGHTSDIDVYVKATRRSGRVRVDL